MTNSSSQPRSCSKIKKGVQFNTFSVQVSPGLPESIADQVRLLLVKGESGADRIIEFLQYYRGNKFVIEAIEDAFASCEVILRSDYILKTLYPKKYGAYLKKLNGDREKTRAYVNREYRLFDLLEKLGAYQDEIHAYHDFKEFTPEFREYDRFMEQQEKILQRLHKLKERSELQKLYFYNVVYPIVFRSVRTSILEYQHSPKIGAELLNA